MFILMETGHTGWRYAESLAAYCSLTLLFFALFTRLQYNGCTMQMTRLHKVSLIQHAVLYLDRAQSALLTLLLIVLFPWIPKKLIVATFISGGIRHQTLEAGRAESLKLWAAPYADAARYCNRRSTNPMLISEPYSRVILSTYTVVPNDR